VRTEKLEELCWLGVDLLEQQPQQHVEGGGSGGRGENGDGGRSATALGGEGGHSSLSPEEEEYFRLYGDMLAAYKGQWTDVDLTGTLEPPKDLFIDVRVLKDAGEIQTEYGYVTFYFSIPDLGCWSALLGRTLLTPFLSSVINLTKNSQLYVRQGDVERLISQGFLERLS
jgi:GINS complex subunit 1